MNKQINKPIFPTQLTNLSTVFCSFCLFVGKGGGEGRYCVLLGKNICLKQVMTSPELKRVLPVILTSKLYSYISNPDCLYFQWLRSGLIGCAFEYSGSDDQLKQFDTYTAALNSWCNEQQMSSVQQVPVCGQSVCVRHTDTGQWRRAQVTRLSDRYESPILLLSHSILLNGIYMYIVYYIVINYQCSTEWFSIECLKTKKPMKVIIPANHKGSSYMYLMQSMGKWVLASLNWFCYTFTWMKKWCMFFKPIRYCRAVGVLMARN